MNKRAKQPKNVYSHDVAKKVLVMMAVGLHSSWKQSVVHFALNAVDNEILVGQITSLIEEVICYRRPLPSLKADT